MNTESRAPDTNRDNGYHSRQGRLALAYKYAIKQILTSAEARYGRPLDPAFREAVMVEMQVFFHKAKDLLGDTDPIHEAFYYQVSNLCQSLEHSKTASTD